MLEIFKEDGQKEREIKEINFADIKRGDKLMIETLSGIFEINVIGKGKDGLRVSVKRKYGEKQEEFTAIMPGGFTMYKEKGLTQGILKIGTKEENNCLYFKNLKDIKTKEKESSSMRTTPIKKIILKV